MRLVAFRKRLSNKRFMEETLMADNYKIIDEKTWERTMHCMVFRNSIEPQFCVTFEADCSAILML